MTTKTAPALPSLSIAIKLGGFKFTPERLKPDGLTRKRNTEIVLEASHEGADAEELLGFLTHVRGDLRVTLVPAEETKLDGWNGVGTIGTVRLELGEDAAVRFPIRVESSKVGILEDLIGIRLAMSKQGESSAVLELVPVQPDLDFEGDGKDTGKGKGPRPSKAVV